MSEDTRARLLQAIALPGDATSDFDLNDDARLAEGQQLRQAGVLCAVQQVEGRAMVWLTMRSSALKHHPGQIAFPGGKVDPGDDGPIGAALRESHEEIGLPSQAVEILGTFPAHETVTGFEVTPVIGWVHAEFDPRPEPGEVAEAFRVPLDHVCDPSRYAIQGRIWRGMERRYFTVPYGPYYIWGATARMLRALADRMEKA